MHLRQKEIFRGLPQIYPRTQRQSLVCCGEEISEEKPSKRNKFVRSIAVGAVLAGATSALSMVNPKAYASMRLWEAGSLAGRDLGVAGITLALVTVGVVAALLLAPGLNVLVLGEDTARSLGSRIKAVRGWSLATIIVLCGTATAAVGPIAFVGLMVPHAVRAVAGADQRTVIAYSLFAGPILLLVADLIARSVIRPHEVPIGVVTAILGAPLLVALVVFRRRAS